MIRLILVAAGGLLLATANSPPAESELSSVVAAPAPDQAAKPAKPAKAAKPAQAVAGAYPRCSASVRDRCQQGGGYGHARHREVQYAMRAGERG